MNTLTINNIFPFSSPSPSSSQQQQQQQQFHSSSNLSLSKFPILSLKNPNSLHSSPFPPPPPPSPPSAMTSVARNSASTSNEKLGPHDLLIVGPGVLGRLVALLWRQDHPGCKVCGQTVTLDHHDELVQIGINPTLKETGLPHKFPHVIFCAPPSRSSDYPGEIRLAASSWSGEGSFLFTSSSAVFDCSDNGLCTEDTPVVRIGSNPRVDVLLKAENIVLEQGGCVLRLSGLYKADRGAHMYWLKQVMSELRPDHIVNQIHYEDAASLAVAIMKKKLRGRAFLGCDNHPLSRKEIMDLVNKSEKFVPNFEGFTGTSGPLGKRLDNSKTRRELGWEPKYSSFAHFLQQL